MISQKTIPWRCTITLIQQVYLLLFSYHVISILLNGGKKFQTLNTRYMITLENHLFKGELLLTFEWSDQMQWETQNLIGWQEQRLLIISFWKIPIYVAKLKCYNDLLGLYLDIAQLTVIMMTKKIYFVTPVLLCSVSKWYHATRCRMRAQ